MSDVMKEIDAKAAQEESPEWLFWRKEIDLAKKREKTFRKQAKEVTDIYESETTNANSFNILYANTETLLPAVYNQLPRAIVERRFEDADPLGKQAASVMERSLTYLLNSPSGEYEQYGDLFRTAVKDAFVPGRGVIWWKYDPTLEDMPEAVETVDPDADGAQAVANQEEHTGEIFPKPGKKVTWETICGEELQYDEFLHGYARNWKKVPWVAREHQMTREDAEENFGEAVAKLMKFSPPSKEDSTGRKKEDDEVHNEGSVETATVYEIWWKQKKKVVFYHPELKDRLCMEVSDPYKLSGFFPCSEPLRFYHKSKLTPTPLYKVYEVQAKELNKITGRISRVVNALKVRGFYDGTIQGLKELLDKEDNTLVAAKNVAALQTGQNLSNSIWFMPLDELIKVVNQLYEAQLNCKNTIYEITGIADIMRGLTQASETATAQNIKSKWGGLRLQSMQGAAQDYIRDNLRIVAELAAEHFDLETFSGMTNLDYATPQEVAQAQQATQIVQQLLQRLHSAQPQALPPPPGSAAGPPPAPQIPPQVQQLQAKIQATMQKPKWEDVLKLLKNDLQRGYKIGIETNSTLANTSGEDQENITKALTAISNMYTSFLPAVQAGAMTMPAFKEMTLTVARRFEFGRQVEQAIEQMPDQLPPPPPDPKVNADLEKQKADLQQREQAMQEQMAAHNTDMQGRESELALKQKEVAGDIDRAKQDLAQTAKQTLADQALAQQKFEMKMTDKMHAHEQSMQKGLMKKQQMDGKAQIDRQKSEATQKAQGEQQNAGTDQLLSTVKEMMAEVQELRKSRDAPIEFIRGEDGKASHVKRGDKTQTIKRDAKGAISGLH